MMKELKESFIDFMMFLLLFTYRMAISGIIGFIAVCFMVYLGIPIAIRPEIILMTAFVVFFINDCIKDYNELKNTDKITIDIKKIAKEMDRRKVVVATGDGNHDRLI